MLGLNKHLRLDQHAVIRSFHYVFILLQSEGELADF